VHQLVGKEANKVINFKSIEELLVQRKAINIASIDVSEFKESLYIKRKMTVELGGQFEDQLPERLNYVYIDELHRQ
jgi:hypothetical protein